MGQAAANTLDLWGEGKALDAYQAHLREHVDRAAGTLSFAGIVDGDRLVASLKRYRVPLLTPGGEVDGMGIGAVFVPEDVRGRRLGKRLLQAVLDKARAGGVGAAWLFSDIDPAYYEAFGFRTQPALEWRADVAAMIADDSLALEATSDLERLHETRASSWSGPWLRPSPPPEVQGYWAWRCAGAEAHVIVDGERDVGHWLTTTLDGELFIHECAWPEGEPWTPLVGSLRRLAEAAGVARVRGWLRPDHAGPPFRAAPRTRSIPMIAALDERVQRFLGRTPAHFSAIDHF